jgi:hypothetical protein
LKTFSAIFGSLWTLSFAIKRLNDAVCKIAGKKLKRIAPFNFARNAFLFRLCHSSSSPNLALGSLKRRRHYTKNQGKFFAKAPSLAHHAFSIFVDLELCETRILYLRVLFSASASAYFTSYNGGLISE